RILAYDDRVVGDVDDHAGDLVNYGLALVNVDRYEDARAAYLRALAILHKIDGPEIEIAMTETNVAIPETRPGRFPEARPDSTRAQTPRSVAASRSSCAPSRCDRILA